MSPGKEPLHQSNVLLKQTSHVDYEELCDLDVLGLSDTAPKDQVACMLNIRAAYAR